MKNREVQNYCLDRPTHDVSHTETLDISLNTIPLSFVRVDWLGQPAGNTGEILLRCRTWSVLLLAPPVHIRGVFFIGQMKLENALERSNL